MARGQMKVNPDENIQSAAAQSASMRNTEVSAMTTKPYDPSLESGQMLNAQHAQNEKYPDTQRILSSKWDSVAAAIESRQSDDEPSL